MSEVLIKIKKMVPPIIFEEPEVKEHFESTFDLLTQRYDKRYCEISNFMTKRGINNYITYDYQTIFESFKLYLFKEILNEVIDITFRSTNSYNVKENILALMTKQRLIEAIYDEPLEHAFTKQIREGHFDSPEQKESYIILLDKTFLTKKNKNVV